MAYAARTLSGQIHGDISNEQCGQILKNKAILLAAHHIEEVFGYVVEGWLEYEDEISKWRVRGQLETVDESLVRGHFFDARASIERRLLSFLSAARMYPEHVTAKVMAFDLGDNASAEELRRLRSRFRKQSAEFIAVDELRNSLQHSDLAINGISFGWARLKNADRNAASETTISVRLPTTKPIQDAIQQRIDREKQKSQRDKKKGCGNQSFIARLEAELVAIRSIPEPLDLRHGVRKFCAHVAAMHAIVRARTAPSVEAAIRCLRELCEKHGEEHCGEKGFVIDDTDGVAHAGKGEWIGTTIIDRLTILRSRYANWQRIMLQAR